MQPRSEFRGHVFGEVVNAPPHPVEPYPQAAVEVAVLPMSGGNLHFVRQLIEGQAAQAGESRRGVHGRQMTVTPLPSR
jgi:hypothetical protein